MFNHLLENIYLQILKHYLDPSDYVQTNEKYYIELSVLNSNI